MAGPAGQDRQEAAEGEGGTSEWAYRSHPQLFSGQATIYLIAQGNTLL